MSMHEGGETEQLKVGFVPAMPSPTAVFARQSARANPDDPIVSRPPQGRNGPLPGPRQAGAPGRVAIVQAQIFIVGLMLVAQLWLVTTALFDLLSAHTDSLWVLTLLSACIFAVVLVVSLVPLRRVRGQ